MIDHRRRLFKYVAIAWVLMLLAVSPLFAANGKIAGVVKDSQSGSPLPGVNVQIVGTMMGSTTDLQGRYFILNVPPGTYQVKASIIGYEPITISDVVSRLDVTTTVDFSLNPTLVEMGGVTIVAERPLVDKTLTATRANIGVKELDNALPAASLDRIVETTASTFKGYIRGGRKYESKTLLDGVNISDSYFSGGTGSYQVYQAYTATRRSDGDENTVVDVNAQSVQELAVLAGTFNAEYDAASAGIINIATRDGGRKLSGKLFLRSSAGGLDHAGPNVYNDLNRFLAEKATLAASTSASDREKAALMTFDQSTIDKIGYGADPTIDGELSLGGPLTSKGNFYFSGRLVNSYGRFPGEFNREITSSLKLNYNLTNSQKLTGNVIINDGGVLGGWKNRAYSSKYKFFPQGNAQNEKLGIVGYLGWTHTLSTKTFYEIKGSYVGRTSRFGYSDDNGDGIIDWGEDGDFLIIRTPEQSEKYLGTQGGGVIGTKRTFFTGDPGNERFHDVAYAAGEYRFGQPGFYYEDLKRNAFQIKGDLTSQITFNHQLKAGFLYRYHTIEDFQQRTQVKVIFDPKFPFEETSFKLHPQEWAFYAQDRIEYQGIIINAGVRVDAFDTGAKQFGNFFNVSRQDTLASGRIIRTQLRDKDVPVKWFVGPRIGVSHPISATAAMHYSWGRFFTPPPFGLLYESYGNFSNPSLPVVQDVGLDPPEATAYEIGTQWSFLTDYVVDVTAYYRDIKNYSTGGYTINPTAGQGFGSYTYYTSFGYADARGIEVTLEKRPVGWLAGRLSYAYSYIKASADASSISPNKNSFAASAFPAGVTPTIPFEDRQQWNTYPVNVTGGGNALESGYDREHRISLTFLMNLPFGIDVTGISTAQSGFWYFLSQTSKDPRGREQDRSPWSYRTDLRLAKGFKLGGTRVGRIFFEGRNIFNQENILTWDSYNPASTLLWEQKQDPTGVLNRPTRSDGTPLYDIARELYFGIDFSF
ncbi:MAG: carboxypeptidase-like regulatory domain-containing protein [candidate division KSB1 bacterium]|nr:carboxypeptidase-like regulatory domain-containing protein [candidate division KSB1 bacterium]MDZ7302085.1 carboxypeptidase-like regulatory domain-containing protein [candidate division KSB1 bacterium]MDZ7311126.1 carboxypeptidase-like regulatory domain-containing protein [candidate division KSB1 bacterium]